MIKGKLGGLKSDGGLMKKKPVILNRLTTAPSMRVEVELNEKKKSLNLQSEWTFDDFKSNAMKLFGISMDRVESFDSIVMLPNKKKNNKCYDEGEEGMERASQKTTNTDESEEEVDVNKLGDLKDKCLVKFMISQKAAEKKQTPPKPSSLKPGGIQKPGGIGGIGGIKKGGLNSLN